MNNPCFAKEFFDLQFSFAQRICAVSGMPLERALLAYTNFYVRFGLGRGFDEEHDGWRQYVAGLQTALEGPPGGSQEGRDWTYRFYLNNQEKNTAPPVTATFGCFSYALRGNGVRLHFRSTEPAGTSPPRCCTRRAAPGRVNGTLRPP